MPDKQDAKYGPSTNVWNGHDVKPWNTFLDMLSSKNKISEFLTRSKETSKDVKLSKHILVRIVA